MIKFDEGFHSLSKQTNEKDIIEISCIKPTNNGEHRWYTVYKLLMLCMLWIQQFCRTQTIKQLFSRP